MTYSDIFYTARDGLRLHARVYGGDLAGDPVICLPGLTRNARDFHELALHLSQRARVRRKVVCFDYRGRGQSAYDPDWRNYTVPVEAGDVVAGLASFGIHRGLFIGTSRGGLIIHVLAASQPDLLGAAVLNDIGPVVESEGLAHIRAYLESARKPASIADAVAQQKETHGDAFPALDEDDWQRVVTALYRLEGGVPLPDFDPALLNQLASFDPDKPMPALWTHFEALSRIPLLAIRGANSTLLSAATLDEMHRRHPNCEVLTVPGQGHPPMLETGTLPERIEAFFGQADRGA